MIGLESIFMQHVAQHGLSYGTMAEYEFRKALFVQSDNEINAHNSNAEETSTMGHNFLSTWSLGEKKRLLGYRQHGEVDHPTILEESNDDSVNWVAAGKVNAVQNQGSCGSCWSFSTTAATETAYAIKHNSLPKLSEQQLVSCSTRNYGCNGGDMGLAFAYLKTKYQNYESAYPYTSGSNSQTGSCYPSLETGNIYVTEYHYVSQNNPSQLKAALQIGAVSVAIQADQSVFQYYRGGIITSPSCGTNLDHAVLAVGYGSENGQEYFLVRNSWGPNWGESGYVKIGVSSGAGTCGINMYPVYALTN